MSEHEEIDLCSVLKMIPDSDPRSQKLRDLEPERETAVLLNK